MKQSIVFIVAVYFLTSCNTLDVYEKTAAFSSHEWKSAQILPFTFTIADTSAPYNFYVVIRHEEREFPLADNTKWLGTGMDDIIEHRITFNTLPIHLKKGNYTFSLQQIMREDPLQHVLNAGIRVEKAKP